MTTRSLKSTIKPLLIVLTFLLISELVARSAGFVFPLEIYKRFERDHVPLKSKTAEFYNGFGARGRAWRKEKLQIAVFGSSIAAQTAIPLPETWPEQTIQMLGWNNAQVDNYALGFNRPQTVTKIANQVCPVKKYDLILLNMNTRYTHDEESQIFKFTYTGPVKYPPKNQTIVGQGLLKLWESLQIFGFTQANATQAKEIDKFNMNQRLQTYNYKLRTSPEAQQRKSYRPPTPIHEPIFPYLETMLTALQHCEARLVWLPESVAYHPQMHQRYWNSQITAHTYFNPQTNRWEFLDEKSVFDEHLQTADHNRQFFIEHGIAEINFYPQLLELLPHNQHLFIDEYHLDVGGAKVAAQVIAAKLQQMPWFSELDLKGKINKIHRVETAIPDRQ